MDNSSPMTTFFRNKWVRLFLIIDAIAIIVVVIFAINNALKTSVLNFNVTPLDAEILVNGREYENGTYRVMPGKYEVEISHEGMVTKEFTVELGAEEITNIVAYLVGEDGGFDFYELKDNYGSYVKLTEIASADNNITTDRDTSAEEFVAKMEKDFELFSILPIVDKTPTGYGLEYGVNYQYDITAVQDGRQRDDCDRALCLYITSSKDKEEQGVLKKVSDLVNSLGYNIERFQIIYEVIRHE